MVCLVVFVAISLGLANEDNSEKVPTAWLDSLAANEWRTDRDIISSYRMKVIASELDKEGEIKDSETEYMYVEVVDGEAKEPVRTDEAGIPIPEDKKKNKKKKEEKAETDPFGLFSKENRENYKFKLLEPDSFGRIRIECDPNKNVEEGFAGITTIDTIYWVPVKVEGRPFPLPKMVKELDMTLEMGPSRDGYFQINKMNTNVIAKFLLMTFRMNMNSSFYDYQFVSKENEE